MEANLTKNCIVCGRNFDTKHKYPVKMCSRECRNKRARLLSGRADLPVMATGTTGAISEMLIAVDLMRRGYATFRALSPSCFCDLIAVKNEKILRVECRTGVELQAKSRVNFPKNSHGKIDIFAVFVRTTGEILYFEPDASTSYKVDEYLA